MVDYYIYGLAILTGAALIGIVIMKKEKKTVTKYDPDTQTYTKIDNPRMKKAKETTNT